MVAASPVPDVRFPSRTSKHLRPKSWPGRSVRVVSGLLVCVAVFPDSPLYGQLTPHELALVYNSNGDDSVELAEHYAEVRGVPREQMLAMPMPLQDSISADAYGKLADRIRGFLQELPNGERIRCLVTFYNVPLRVLARGPTEIERQKRQVLQTLQEKTRQDLLQLLKRMAEEAGEKPQAEPNETAGREALIERYEHLRKRLITRSRRLDDRARGQANRRLLGFVERAEGVTKALSLVRASFERTNREDAPEQNPGIAGFERLDQAQAQSRRVQTLLDEIRSEGPMSDRYQEALELLPRWHGLLGLYRWLDEGSAGLTGEDSHAAFDSELSLVLWDVYSPYRSQPNLLNPEVAARTSREEQPRTLMVSRIDAPTPAAARRMIDDAVAVERTGLTGRCYIDARGLKGTDLYARFDRDLFDLAELVQGKTEVAVRLDTREEVFPPGSCEDAALYCGWYSVEKYVPAFRFNPGAIGFHIASFELTSLRSKEKHYWCAGLLGDGAAATLGATSEPYLTAFPRPSRFFGLLLTGRYTLVECFYQSKPFNSWQLALLGDPLYRPFAWNPQLKLNDLKTLLRVKEP